MKQRSFTFSGRLRSFRWSIQGLILMLATQHNAWIHALATVVVCGTALWLGLTSLEWCAILFAVVSVWTAEALNTAFELLADAATPEYHPLVGKAKNVAAAAVLISAIGAVIVAVLILFPHLASQWGH